MNRGEKNTFVFASGKANLYVFIISCCIVVLCLFLFFMVWKSSLFLSGFSLNIIQFISILSVGLVIHELLHGAIWALWTPEGVKSIKFWIKFSALTPYCHCKEPLKVKHYKIGIISPLIILGIIPLIVSLIIGNRIIYFYGMLFSCMASGDIIVLFLLWKLGHNRYVSDHPTKMGFTLLENDFKL